MRCYIFGGCDALEGAEAVAVAAVDPPVFVCDAPMVTAFEADGEAASLSSFDLRLRSFFVWIASSAATSGFSLALCKWS